MTVRCSGFWRCSGASHCSRDSGGKGGGSRKQKDGAVVASRVDSKCMVVATATSGDEFGILDEETDKVDKQSVMLM